MPITGKNYYSGFYLRVTNVAGEDGYITITGPESLQPDAIYVDGGFGGGTAKAELTLTGSDVQVNAGYVLSSNGNALVVDRTGYVNIYDGAKLAAYRPDQLGGSPGSFDYPLIDIGATGFSKVFVSGKNADGTYSTLSSSGLINVGVGATGDGLIDVLNDGLVTGLAMRLGGQGGTGTINLGSGGDLQLGGNGEQFVDAGAAGRGGQLYVGQGGVGSATLVNGATITVTGDTAQGTDSARVVVGSGVDTTSSGLVQINGGGTLRIEQKGDANFANVGSLPLEAIGLQVGVGAAQGVVNVNGGNLEIYGDGAIAVVGVGGGYDQTLTSQLNITNGGVARIDGQNHGDGELVVGLNYQSKGSVTVDGTGSRLYVESNRYIGGGVSGVEQGRITVGAAGEGSLYVSNGGEVGAGRMIIGRTGYDTVGKVTSYGATKADAGGSGYLRVDGAASVTLYDRSDLYPTRTLVLGASDGTTGKAVVTDGGSLNVERGYGEAIVGEYGVGYLSVLDGGYVSAGRLRVASGQYGAGNVYVNSTQAGRSTLRIDSNESTAGRPGQLYVGDAYGSSGGLYISSGGDVVVANKANYTDAPQVGIALAEGATGSVEVQGDGTLRVIEYGAGGGYDGPTLTVGGRGFGSLDVQGGTVEVRGENARLDVSGGGADGNGGYTGGLPQSILYAGGGATISVNTTDYTIGSQVVIGRSVDGNGQVTLKDAGTTLSVGSTTAPNAGFNPGRLEVGALGSGVLNVQDGARAEVARLVVGGQSVYLTGGKVTNFYYNSPDGNVGGSGTVDISGGAQVVAADTDVSSGDSVLIGASGPAVGVVTVRDSGSYLQAYNGDGRIVVGGYGTGTLNVLADADVNAGQLIVGRDGSGTGTVNVNGTGSYLTVSSDYQSGASIIEGGAVFLGQFGSATGSLNVINGGKVAINNTGGSTSQSSLYVGHTKDSRGYLDVNSGGNVTVYQYGPFANGLPGARVFVGNGGYGKADVDGAGSSIDILGAGAELIVGAGGQYNGTYYQASLTSRLSVTNGATVLVDSQTYGYDYQNGGDRAGSTVFVGAQQGSKGQITVDGVGSTLTVTSTSNYAEDYDTGRINVGSGGEGLLSISNGGAVYARQLRVAEQAHTATGSYGNYVAPGDIIDAASGTVVVNNSTLQIDSSLGAYFGGVRLARASGTYANLTVTGDSGSLVSQGGAGVIRVGRYGEAQLNVLAGGDAKAFFVDIARGNGSDGDVTVDGAGSTLLLSNAYGAFETDYGQAGFLRAGRFDGSDGKVTITNSGQISVINDPTTAYDNPRVVLGGNQGSRGELSVSGGNSTDGYSTLLIQQTGPVGEYVGKTNGTGADGPTLNVGASGLGVANVYDGGQIDIIGARARIFVGTGGTDQNGDPYQATVSSTLTISKGADVLVDSQGYGYDPANDPFRQGAEIVIGADLGSRGLVRVEDSDSTLIVTSTSNIENDFATGRVNVGAVGYGQLYVENDAFLQARGVRVGQDAVSATNGQVGGYVAAADLVGAGKGTFNVTDATVLLDGSLGDRYSGLRLADSSGTTGNAVISGATASVTVTGGAGLIRVGNYGSGGLEVEAGASVYGFFVDVGRGKGGDGDLIVDGAGSSLLVSNAYGTFLTDVGEAGFLRAGREAGSDGRIEITNGGEIAVVNDEATGYDNPFVQLGRNAGSNGSLFVNGGDAVNGYSTLRIQQYGPTGDYIGLADGIGPYGPGLAIGDGGAGYARVDAGGQIEILGAAARLLIADGRLDENGVEVGGTAESRLIISGGGDVLVDGQDYGGRQTFTLYDGTEVTRSQGGVVVVGNSENSTGVLEVQGAGSTLTVRTDYSGVNGSPYDGSLLVGFTAGDGNVIVNGGGAISAFGLFVGDIYNYQSGSGYVYVGGKSSIDIVGDAYQAGNGIDLGLAVGASGNLTVRGAGAQVGFTSPAGTDGRPVDEAALTVGGSGGGQLYIDDGGVVQAFNLQVGEASTGDGKISVNGLNSLLEISEIHGSFAAGGVYPAEFTSRTGALAQIGGAGVADATVSGGGILRVTNNQALTEAYRGVDVTLDVGAVDGGSGLLTIAGYYSPYSNPVQNGYTLDRSTVEVLQFGRGYENTAADGYRTAQVRVGANGAEGLIEVQSYGALYIKGEGAELSIGVTGSATNPNGTPLSAVNITGGGVVTVDSTDLDKTDAIYTPYTQGASVFVGDYDGGRGQLTVSGTYSQLRIYSDNASNFEQDGITPVFGANLTVGANGYGQFLASDNASVIISSTDDLGTALAIGYGDDEGAPAAVGVAIVTSGATIAIGSGFKGDAGYNYGAGGVIIVGGTSNSSGSLTISNAGIVLNNAANSSTSIAANTGSTGVVTVTDSGSILKTGQFLTVGARLDSNSGVVYTAQGGAGTLYINSGGEVQGANNTIGESGILSINGGTLTGYTDVFGDFFVGGDGSIGIATLQDGGFEQRSGLLEFEVLDIAGGSGDLLYSAVTDASTIQLDGSAITVDATAVSAAAVGDQITLIQTAAGLDIDSLELATIQGDVGPNARLVLVEEQQVIGQDTFSALVLEVQDIFQNEVFIDTTLTVGDIEGDDVATAGVLSLVISRSGDLSQTLSVDYEARGSAPNPADGADFAAGATLIGTATFGVGIDTITIDFPLEGDLIDEGDESVTFEISNPVSASIDPYTITTATDVVQILNDDIPDVTIAGDLTVEVPADGQAALTSLDLSGTEAGLTPDQIIYSVGSTVGGDVFLASDLTSATLTFTQADVDARLVRFVDTDAANAGGSFDITVFDQAGRQVDRTILVQEAAPTELPVIAGDFSVRVDPGQATLLTTADLAATESGATAGDLIYDVASATNGFVALVGSPGTPITRFSQSDIDGGQVQFEHDGGAGATAEFSVTVTDLEGEIAGPQLVDVIVQRAPNAVTDLLSLAADSNQLFDVFADNGIGADNDPNGDPFTVNSLIFGDSLEAGTVGATNTFTSGADFTLNADGTLQFNTNGAFDFLDVGEIAQEFVSYDITDGFDVSNTASVFITINGVNDAPVAIDDLILADEDLGTTGDVFADNLLGLDFDPEMQAFSVISVDGVSSDVGQQVLLASGALLTLNSDGTFDYDTNGSFEFLAGGETATDSFTYTIADTAGLTSTAQVMLTIDGQEDAPVFDQITFTADEDTPFIGQITAIDVDTDLADLTFTLVSPGAGTVDLSPSGVFQYTPAAEFVGTDAFDVSVTDGVNTVTTTVTVDVLDASEIDILGGLQIFVGDLGQAAITSTDLSGDDSEGGNVVFSVSNVVGGQIELATNPGQSVTTFSQTEIDARDVRFVDDGTGAAGRSFDVTVTDGAGVTRTETVTVRDPEVLDLSDFSEGSGTVFVGAGAYSYAGVSVFNAGDLNGDGIDDLLIGAPDIGPNALNSPTGGEGAAYVVFGQEGGFDGPIDLGDLGPLGFKIFGLGDPGEIGADVASGDVNGDGFDDIVIGAPASTIDGATDAGAVIVIFGADERPAAPIDIVDLSAADGLVISGVTADEAVGLSVSVVGDIDNDGIDDIGIGAPFGGPGEAYVIFGKTDAERGGLSDLDLSTLDPADGFSISGGLGFGYSIDGAGDVNGDGVDDFIVSSSDEGDPAAVIFGVAGGPAPTGAFDLTTLNGANGFRIVDEASAQSFSLTGAELLTDPRVTTLGGTTVVQGNSLRFIPNAGGELLAQISILGAEQRGGVNVSITVDYTPASADNDFIFGLNDGVDFAGWERSDNSGGSWFTRDGAFTPGALPGFTASTTGLGGVDVFTQTYEVLDEEEGTSMTIVEGADTTSFDFVNANLDTDLGLNYSLFAQGSNDIYVVNSIDVTVESSALEGLGSAVAGIGDINGDGIDDIAIGAIGAEENAPGAGAVSVIFGTDQGFAADVDAGEVIGANGFLILGAEGDRIGGSIAGAGDLNGDGIDDLLIGAPAADSGGTNAGRTYVIFGDANGISGVIDLSTRPFFDDILVIEGALPGDMLGGSVAAGGDNDGDGIADFLIGAPGFSADGVNQLGAATFISGTEPFYAPDIFGDLGLEVSLGGVATITNLDLLAVSEGDAPADLLYHVTNLSGGSVISLAQGAPVVVDRFTQLDVDNGLIAFQDDAALDPFNTFDVTVTDATGEIAGPETVFIETLLPPTTQDDLFDVFEDGFVTGNVFADNGLGPDIDLNGDPLQVIELSGFTLIDGEPLSGANGGEVIVNSDGSFTFDTLGDFDFLIEGETATEIFTITVGDGTGLSSTSDLTFTIIGENDAPITAPDEFTTDQDTPIMGGLNVLDDNGFGDDFDPEGDPLTVVAVNGLSTNVGAPVTLANGGVLFVTDTGEVSFDPFSGEGSAYAFLAPGETLQETFTYTVTDLDGSTTTQTSRITIAGLNDGVVAQDDEFNVQFDQVTVLNVTQDNGFGVDFDIDGTPVFLSTINGEPVLSDDGPAAILLPSGALVRATSQTQIEYFANGAFGALNANQTAQDSFTYTISDEFGETDTATVNLTLIGENAAPIAAPDTAATDEDTPVEIDVIAGVLDDGGTTGDATADPGFTGEFDPGFTGEFEPGFTDELSPGLTGELGESPTTGEDFDPEGGPLTVVAVEGQSLDNGPVTLASGARVGRNEEGRLVFDPRGAFDALAAGVLATDTFVYTVADDQGATDTASVIVEVTGVNDDPTARTDRFSTSEDDAVSGDLLADNGFGADSDIDSGALAILAVNGAEIAIGAEIELASGALVTVQVDGTFVYDPNASFEDLDEGQTAQDSFTYTLSDGQGGTATAEAQFQILGQTDVNFIRGTDGQDVRLGTEGQDEIDGAGGGDFLSGLAGDDTIIGGAGADVGRGGADNDLLLGGGGGDRLLGEGGNDMLRGEDGDDILRGQRGDDTLSGGSGQDTLSGSRGNDLMNGGEDDDLIRGGGGSDTMRGGNGDDRMRGGRENDLMRGEDGADTMAGGSGDDTLDGGDGADRLRGRSGDDEMSGGAGADRFQFRGSDDSNTILDYEDGIDRIQIIRGADSFDALTIVNDQGDALITFASTEIRVANTAAGDLDQDDFIF